jgi:hypothetical protein
MITVQSYINSFFAFRRGLSSCILPRFVLHGTELRVVFSSGEWFGTESREFASFLVQGTEFRVVFSSAEGFETEFREYASIFVPWNGIPSCFLFRGRVRNGIPRGFCSAEQPEFRRKSPFVPSTRSSAKLFFCRKFPTLVSKDKVNPYCLWLWEGECHKPVCINRLSSKAKEMTSSTTRLLHTIAGCLFPI